MKRTCLALLLLLLALANPCAQPRFDYDSLAHYTADELFRRGNDYLDRNDRDTAMPFFLTIIGNHEHDTDRHTRYLIACSYAAIGDIYYQQGYYSEAFDSFTTAIRLCEQQGFDDLLPEAYNNLGKIYCTWQDYTQGLLYYKKALEAARPEQKNLQRKLLINIIGVSCGQGDTQEARRYYDRLAQLPDDALTRYFLLYNQGLILDIEGDAQGAIGHYHRAYNHAVQHRMGARYTGPACSSLADLYAKDHPDSALYYYHKGLTDDMPPYMKRHMLKQLAALYRSRDRERAIDYMNRYLTLSDSLFNETEINRQKGAQFIYESEKNYEKIKRLNEERQTQRRQIKAQRNALLTGSGVLAVFIALVTVLLVQQRKLRRAYRDLFRRSNEMLKTERVNRHIQEELETTVAHLKAQIATQTPPQSAATPQPETPHPDATAPDEESEAADRPQSSVQRLTDEQKQEILSAINRVVKTTNEVYDCDFNIERLAHLTGYNSKYLSKVINDTYQCNFRTYINEFRIKEAQARLLDTQRYGQYTIAAIAQSVGYRSHANFIQLFKKAVGISPSAYKKMTEEMKGDDN